MRNIFARKKRILIYGDYNCTTGFSTVTTNILRQLQVAFKGKVQFDVIAINWYGDRLADDYEIKKNEAGDVKEVDEMIDGKIIAIKKRIRKIEGNDTIVYSAYHHDGKSDLFGRNAMLSMLNHIDYHLVFMIQDLGIVSSMLPTIRKIKSEKKFANKKQTKLMYYFPMDGATVSAWFNDFDVIDRLIAYTEYARKEVLKVRPDLKMGVILHGIDTDTFGPLPYSDVLSFREAFFGDNAGKTIISNINRNQHRKDIPTTIFAFEEYLREVNSNAFLYLHMNPEDLQGWNLKTVMAQTSLVQGVDYMFTPPDLISKPPDVGFMNCIYNASDLYVTTTTGEGFGYTIVEAMAARIPVIAPYHTSIMEISDNDRIWTVDSDTFYVSRFDNMIRRSANYENVALMIEEALSNPQECEVKMDKAYSYAKSLSWNSIGRRWIDEFKNLL